MNLSNRVSSCRYSDVCCCCFLFPPAPLPPTTQSMLCLYLLTQSAVKNFKCRKGNKHTCALILFVFIWLQCNESMWIDLQAIVYYSLFLLFSILLARKSQRRRRLTIVIRVANAFCVIGKPAECKLPFRCLYRRIAIGQLVN